MLGVKPRNMLTQLGEWTRLDFPATALNDAALAAQRCAAALKLEGRPPYHARHPVRC
jgi:hypothetical protein